MIPTIPNGEPQKGQSSVARREPPVRTETAPQPRTQSPQESLGLSARAGLVKASIQAGIGFVVLFAGLTVGPYFWEKSQASTEAAPAPAEKSDTPPAGQPPVAPAPSSPDPAAPGKLPPAGVTAGAKVPGKGDIVDKLGENGTKVAPTKVNPLDKKDDDILKELK